ncbi:MAG: hypothetical protein EOM20_16795 [Spartobacteria bacterium]|nr:hypothetical protein [Spartobacteria bacterium]
MIRLRYHGLVAIAMCFLLSCIFPPVRAHARIIEWAGQNWVVKHGEGLGPGPNDWSDSTNNVWIDENGFLHLKITGEGSDWQCAEIISEQSFSYGEYRFYVATAYDLLDTNVVGGLFTYYDDNNEIDIEFVRAWTGTNNANFVTQPARTGNFFNYYSAFTEGTYSTHRFQWETNFIAFESYFGHAEPPPNSNLVSAAWLYTGENIPLDQNEKVHINMWLFQGRSPQDTNHLELILTDFAFIASTNTLPPESPELLHDDFDDFQYTNRWETINDPSLLAETNGTLRVRSAGYGADQSGVVSADPIVWNGASGCVLQTQIDWIHVTQTNTLLETDVNALLALVSAPGAIWFAEDAAVLFGAYSETNDHLAISFATKQNMPSSMGIERFSGMISNASTYLGQGGITLAFQLDDSRFLVSASDSDGFPIPMNGSPPDNTGLHAIGTSLTNAWVSTGAQNQSNGIAYIYYDWIRAIQTNAIATNAPPPPSTSNQVVIGDGTYIRRNPVNAYYEQERLQVLYYASEIPHTGTLISLALEIEESPTITLHNYTIRMQHTTLDEMPEHWISNDWEMVYRENTDITEDQWHTFTFQHPFYYNGTNNLLIDFSKNNDSWIRNGYVYISLTPEYRSYEQFIDNSTDPLTWTGSLPIRSRYPPKLRKSIPNIRLTFSEDGDNDGLPDTWEYTWCGNLTNLSGDADFDNDQFPDQSEYRAGTDPLDAMSSLNISACAVYHPALPVIHWSSVTGKAYRVQRMTTMADPSISTQFGPYAATPPFNSFTDAPPTECSTLFYRIVLE